MIYFEPGMWIEEGMRYTDGIRRYIAIRSGQTSPYYRTNYLHGPGIILPRKFIKPCFDWIDTQTNEKLLPHDDLMITEYFRTHHIPMLTVFPNIIQHPDDDTLLPYSYSWKRISPWFKEEPAANWETKEIQKI
jgi:hypothetical protein